MGDTLSCSSAEKNKRRFALNERDEEQQDLLSKIVKEKANMKQKRLKLYEKRIGFGKWKAEKEVLRVKKAQ